MEALLQHLGQVVNWLLSILPHYVVIRKTHGGLKFVGGSKLVELKPGIRWYWPIITQFECEPVTRQTFNLPNQVLETSDGVQVLVSGVVRYRISDVIKAFGNAWDFNEIMRDSSMAAVVTVVCSKTHLELRTSLADRSMIRDLTRQVRRELKPYGVSVQKAYLSDFARCVVIRNVANDSSINPAPQVTINH